MSLKKLVAIAYILTGIVITLVLIVGIYVKISGKGIPMAHDGPETTNPASGDVAANSSNSTVSNNPSSNSANSPSAVPPTSGSTSPGAGSSNPPTATTPSPTPTPTPAPPPTPAPCGGQTPCYSSANVATHNTSGNCWVTMGSIVYNVTSYVSQHPGGQSVFNASTCGHDITAFMNGSASTAGKNNNHNSSAYSILNSYKNGYLQ